MSALQHPLRSTAAPLRICCAPQSWLTRHLLSTHSASSSLELGLCLKMFSVLHLYCEALCLSFLTLSIFIILISSYHLPHSYQLGSYLRAHIVLLLLLLSRFSRVRFCATPYTAAYQVLPSLGFSRQEHWSGLPFPSPMHESEK